MSTYFLYVGTYGEGIYGYRYSPDTGKLDPMGVVAKIAAPSFLASDRDYRHLYAVSEATHGNGAVAGFSINRQTGALTELNSLSSEGTSPCHLVLDHSGKILMAANYGTGSVPVYPVESDGKLGTMATLLTAEGSSVNPQRQKGPHAHQTVISSDNKFLYVPDLGLDQIRIYRLDPANHKVTPNDPPFAKLEAGYGPRHMVLSPNGKFAYVVNELKSFVTAFSRNSSTGALEAFQNASTLPEGYSGAENNPAEILIDKAGKHIYASNRGAGSIAVFSIDSGSGKLTQVQVADVGTIPRGVEIDPTGHVLFAGDQKGNRFATFTIDAASGKLTPTGNTYDIPTPVAFYFVPAK
jgi:6-phosphogluconolactonase